MTQRSGMGRNARPASWLPIEITGAGHFYPSDVVDNATFARRCEFNLPQHPDELARDSKMVTRRWCTADENTATMAIEASRMALADSGTPAHEIDVVVVSSCSTIPGFNYPDSANPVVADLAPLVLEDIGRDGALGIDIKATYCAGFIRALQIMDGLLQNPNYRSGLIVASDVGGRFATAPSNRSGFCFIIGDAAGAVVLRRNPDPEARSAHIGIVDYEGGMHPSQSDVTAWGPDGRSVVVRGERAQAATMAHLISSAEKLLVRNQLTPADVKWLLPMQTHAAAITQLREALDWPEERVLWTGNITGYSASASIPAAFSALRHDGTIAPGDLVLSLAVGAGLNGSGALYYA